MNTKRRSKKSPSSKTLSPELTRLISKSVAVLGQVIREEAGEENYLLIEKIRHVMKTIRSQNPQEIETTLAETHSMLNQLSSDKLALGAHSSSLMLELINSCEYAYRTYRLRRQNKKIKKANISSIELVLTAHPTEARSQNVIKVFHQIINVLVATLENGVDNFEIANFEINKFDRDIFDADSSEAYTCNFETELKTLLKIAWALPIANQNKPKVSDEANFIYSLALTPNILDALVTHKLSGSPVSLATWVGGDKDGHPGVGADQFHQSLSLSRQLILQYLMKKYRHIKYQADLLLLSESKADQIQILSKRMHLRLQEMEELGNISSKDGALVLTLRKSILEDLTEYRRILGNHPAMCQHIEALFEIFPGLVMPIEFRESSELVTQACRDFDSAKLDSAIFKMLEKLKEISLGGSSLWYVKCLVLSHTEKSESLFHGIELIKSVFGQIALPVVPLFEDKASLEQSKKITQEFLDQPKILTAYRKLGSKFEVMLGYSDSAKESGALQSRLLIKDTLHTLEKLIQTYKLTPVFFHGSGGSIARGGGDVYEQTSWWPKSALENFKTTIQGESVFQIFATPEVFQRHIEKVAIQSTAKHPRSPGVAETRSLAGVASEVYKNTISQPDFVQLLLEVTPYPFLSALNFGSRPSKRQDRGQTIEFSSLRAIPWVLCWNQTRNIFPAWWGIGTAWAKLNHPEKIQLRKAYQRSKLLFSYVKLIAHSLATANLPIWNTYLSQSPLPEERKSFWRKRTNEEFDNTKEMIHFLSQKKKLLWYRSWLEDSIYLRSAYIHPLNLIQIIAMKRKDEKLFRSTVTGIAIGMMNSG